MRERLAKLNFATVAIGVFLAVTLGGFTLSAMQISRMNGRISALEGKLGIVTVKMAEMSGVY